jgi:hypothetical protein
MKLTRLLGAATIAAGLLLTSQGSFATDAPSLSNKWRIECNHVADNDGTISFRVTPEAGTPVDVNVNVKKGAGENHVAHNIRDAFKATLDEAEFHVEVDDGEDVLVKKRKGPNFALEITNNTVTGTRLQLEKE